MNKNLRHPQEGDSASKLPVFSDPTRARQRRVKVFSTATMLALALWCVAVGHRIVNEGNFILPINVPATHSAQLLFGSDDATMAVDKLAQTVADVGLVLAPNLSAMPICHGPRGRADAFSPGARDTYAFLPLLPVWSYVSFETHCAQIDVLVPAWYEISGPERSVRNLAPGFEHDDRIQNLISSNRDAFALMPSIALPDGATIGEIETLLGSPDLRQAIADQLLEIAVSNDLDGICFDTGGFPPAAIDLATDVAQRLDVALESAQLKTCTVMSFDNRFWTETDLVASSDRVVVTMIREPFAGSFPAPVAPHQWFVESAAFVADIVPLEKLVFALGTGGYQWEAVSTEPVWNDYTSIVSQAAQDDGLVEFFDIDLNSRATFIDEKGRQHVSWMLDAASFHNQLRALEGYGLAGIAVWTLGREDPGVWDVLALQGATFADLIARIGTVSVAGDIRYIGDGPFRRLSSEAVAGIRMFRDDAGDALIHAQDYSVLPEPVLIERFGRLQENQITLTFDDGPDPVFTEQILDILRDKGVKATFFVVGRNITVSQDVLSRIAEEGHIIGQHTMLHPRLESVTASRVRLELNALQRIVSGLTGHRMVLFRTPYGHGAGPDTAEIAQPIRIATSLGYIEMGSDVVARDWTNISADEILQNVRQGIHDGGTVIMLHDSGGDRSATVAALGPIIDQLRADGYKFVPASDLLGLSHAELMPVDLRISTALDGYTFSFVLTAASGFLVIFWATVVLGVLRSLTIFTLALRRRHTADSDPTYQPSVTVVVAAFNEAMVIESSIQTILESDYDNLQVLVIDDGSTDSTAMIVQATFRNDPRVYVRRQANGGKWRALNAAYNYVSTDIVVAIDADTILRKDAIRKLVAPFQEPSVGAVAGNVKVGNRLNLLTRLQALEYVIAQNLERRAFDRIGGMLVVPGAIGAWRVTAVRQAGGYSGETLAEDADLTVSIQRNGYTTRFVEDAISVTEAPATLVPFLKQRLRWTFGMMQLGWKHRACFAERRAIGMVSLPDLYLFGVLFGLLAPVADFMFITTLGVAVSEALAGRPAFDTSTSIFLIAGYCLLPLMDILMAWTAIRLDRRNGGSETYSQLWLLPFQRFFYRQLLYFTVYRSFVRALTGRLAKWGNLKRMGTVKVDQWT